MASSLHFLQTTKRLSESIFLDFDTTDDPIHENQEGKFFHGDSKNDCYLPLYVFCGYNLLFVKLKPTNIDVADRTVEILEKIVTQVRLKWDDIKIVMRGDSGFCRDGIMSWWEANRVSYVIGLPKLKIGGWVRWSCRRIYISLSESYAFKK